MSCAPAVRGLLERIDGVDSASVSFQEKTARVRMQPGKALTREDCQSAFEGSSYSVVRIEELASP